MIGVIRDRHDLLPAMTPRARPTVEPDALRESTDREDAIELDRINSLDYAADGRFPPRRPTPGWVHRGVQSERSAA